MQFLQMLLFHRVANDTVIFEYVNMQSNVIILSEIYVLT